MRKIVSGLFISLNGVIEAANEWIGQWFNPELGQAVGSMIRQPSGDSNSRADVGEHVVSELACLESVRGDRWCDADGFR